MKNITLFFVLAIFCLTWILSGCGGTPAPVTAGTPAPETQATEAPATGPAVQPTVGISTTPDPCVSPQIEENAQKVQRYMREFDDASNLAANVPQSQLNTSIADLQRIRREADDEQVPPCLADLKNYEIQHMNAAIDTFLAVLRLTSGEPIDCSKVENTLEQQSVCQNFALATQFHDQYLLELARVLGQTVVPATPGAAGTPPETSTP